MCMCVCVWWWWGGGVFEYNGTCNWYIQKQVSTLHIHKLGSVKKKKKKGSQDDINSMPSYYESRRLTVS